MDRELEVSTIRRVSTRLLPLLFVLMIVNYLDRVNVGFAALRMNQDLGFTGAIYGFGAGVFFIGYALVEIPSNLLLYKFGARIWICRIMVTWGLIATAMAFVRSPTTFYTLRFCLGVAEAGFLPGVVFYISTWFPVRHRARANAWVFCATVLSPVLGAPLSTGIMAVMQGVAGLPGWQWMFILEGIPAVLLGIVVLFSLTNSPAEATWLQPDQRQWLVDTMATQKNALERESLYTISKIWRDKRIWQLGILFSCLNAGSYGLLLWMPQIVKGLGQLSDLTVGLLTTIPFILGFFGQVLVSRHSDKVRERRFHLAACYLFACFFLLASAVAPGPVLGYIALCFVGGTLFAGTPIFWTLVGTFMTGAAGAAGIALINSIAQIGGFFGPYLIGVIRDATQSFTLALCMLAAFLATAGLIATTLTKCNEGDDNIPSEALSLPTNGRYEPAP